MNPSPGIAVRASRILIVDDERPNRELMEAMLTGEGFELLTAASGEEALAMVAQHSPNLILLDVLMPRMDGHQVAARIKGKVETRGIAIIMISGMDDHHDRMLAMQAGADDLLAKPVDRAELCLRVKNLLSSGTLAVREKR